MNRIASLLEQGIDSDEELRRRIRGIHYFHEGGFLDFVLIISDYNHVNEVRQAIYQIQWTIQDELSFPENLRIKYIIRTRNNFFQIEPFDENSFIPSEIEAYIAEHQVLRGNDINDRSDLQWRNNKLNPFLDADNLLIYSKKYPHYLPLIHPYTCWQRSDFSVNRRPLGEFTIKDIDGYIEKSTHNNIHLYGRYWGSGKTGLMYWIMSQLAQRAIPFIYRSAFWKDENGKYKEDDEGLNEGQAVTKWLLDTISSFNKPEKAVILLDEVDFVPSPELDQYLIISGAKELPEFLELRKFKMYDLMVDFPFQPSDLALLIKSLMSNETKLVFSSELVEDIAHRHHKWRFPNQIKDPAAAIRIASYSLASAIYNYEHQTRDEILVTQDDVDYWIKMADSPYINHYPEVHDVHAEFLVFDGDSYISVDPHYKFALP